MSDPDLKYRIWRHGGAWHWQVIEAMKGYQQFLGSGVARSERAARIEALQRCLRYIDNHLED